MSLTQTNAVIDFGHNDDRVTIKAKLDAVLASSNPADFTIRVIVTDLRTGMDHDTGPRQPDNVR